MVTRRPPLSDDVLALLSGRTSWETHPLPGGDGSGLFLSDGPHGVRKPTQEDTPGLGDSAPATCFPTASALACSWDPALMERVGTAIGAEARALGVDVLLGPGLNLKRTPLGGRCFEYFSEDPLLSGVLAAAHIRGVQSAGVGACAKHFVANATENDRMVHDAVVDPRTLRELYLHGFEIAVQEGDPVAIMAAYNRVGGTYACEHEALLTGVLRGEWGFSGIVMSDWGAIDDRVAALQAGLDLEMPSTRGEQIPVLQAALRRGDLRASTVHAAVERLCAARDRVRALQAAAPAPRPLPALAPGHHALAREAAARCCVLLENDGVLPLDPTLRVALVGPMATTPRYQGAGSSGVVPTQLVSLRDALADALGGRLVEPVTGALDPLAAALSAAESADVAVVAIGLPEAAESEAFDRTHLRLPGKHEALLENVLAAGVPTVVVLCHGAPVELPWADRVSALLTAGLSGQAGGAGIADVLTGAAPPSGRLADSVFHRLEDHASTPWVAGTGRRVQFREGPFVGYRYADSVGLEVRYPFGFGRSTTTFSLSEPAVTRTDQGWQVRLTVTNTGPRAGVEVVQVYAQPPRSPAARPAHHLAGWARVELDAGAQAQAEITVPLRTFRLWNRQEGAWCTPGGAATLQIGTSSRDLPLSLAVQVPTRGPAPPADPPVYQSPSHPLRPSAHDFAALLGHAIPPPVPLRPFTRRSTFADLDATWMGAALHASARLIARRTLAPTGDPELVAFADAVTAALPLRGMITLQASLSWAQLDRLLLLLNGRPGAMLAAWLWGARRD